MKLTGWKKRLQAHQALMNHLEDNGQLDVMYLFERSRWNYLHQRLGFLLQKVETLGGDAHRKP